MDATTQIWIVIKQSTNLEWNEQFWSGRTHTLTTTTTGSKHSQKEANNQTDYQSHNALGPPPPPKGPFFTGSWSWMKSSARHTLSNLQAQPKEAETVNLTENDTQLTFKAPC